MADISTIYSDIDAIDSEVSNQYDQLEIARTMLLNKAAGGGGGDVDKFVFEVDVPDDFTSTTTTTIQQNTNIEMRDFMLAHPDSYMLEVWESAMMSEPVTGSPKSIRKLGRAQSTGYVYVSSCSIGERWTDDAGAFTATVQTSPTYFPNLINFNRNTGMYYFQLRCNASGFTLFPAGHYKCTFYAI